ncbi:hypothetical protein KSP39_PZI002513 [Platanthera zijinensis]|uniref:Uncharacterized protein n=1 Tax=Platanthera zijinensis TaxID=2320716 RepID=A0AAP0BZ38_9ASPA
MSIQALLLPSLIPFPPRLSFDSRRRRFPGARATDGRKRANLVARKKKRVKLPEFADGHGTALSISEFLHHPSGVEALLNTRSLDGFESLGSNTYRCFLQKIQFLMLEVVPVLELRVIPTSEDCTVEMLSCRFEGSESMKRQNDLFSAFMKNHITWEMNGSETFLDVHVDLSLSLEVSFFFLLS